VTSASTEAATAALARRAALWGVGRFYVADRPVDFEIGWDDRRRDTAWARSLLAEHGVGKGTGLIVVGGMPESPWFDPVETAAVELGAPYSIGEVHAFEAFRTAMYAHRLPIRMIFGLNRTVAEAMGDQLTEVVGAVPIIAARPSAVPLVEAAGGHPFTVTRIGPALAVECPERTGAHVNDAEWSLSLSGGELCVTTAGPRACRVERLPLGIAGTVHDDVCACGRTGQRVDVVQSQEV
jgi:hypothetical protein